MYKVSTGSRWKCWISLLTYIFYLCFFRSQLRRNPTVNSVILILILVYKNFYQNNVNNIVFFFTFFKGNRYNELSLITPTTISRGSCTATEMIPTIEMIPATEMTPNHHRNDPHHRNDTYSQSKWSRHKFSEPWLKWTWDFAIYSKFFVYSCKHDSKQRKIEKAIRLITVLYTDFIFKILTFF